MKQVMIALAACAALCAAAKPVAVKVEGTRYYLDSEDVKAVGAATPDACIVVVPKLDVLWADYTNRMERARLMKERRDAARRAHGENVNGQPPVRPWRARPAKAMRVPASGKGGAK